MIAKLQLQAFIKLMSIVMLFITFFSNYILFQGDLIESFIRGVITFILSTIILNIVFLVWHSAFSNKDWKLIINVPAQKEALEVDENNQNNKFPTDKTIQKPISS